MRIVESGSDYKSKLGHKQLTSIYVKENIEVLIRKSTKSENLLKCTKHSKLPMQRTFTQIEKRRETLI